MDILSQGIGALFADPSADRAREYFATKARGLSPHARRVLQSGEVACTEWTNYTLAVRFKAAAMGLPFLPARSMLGTDTFRRSAACAIACPFTGERLIAVPALFPDVAAIH